LPFAAQLDACPALPQPEPGTFNIVRVEPGDTLPEIAERSLGDSNRWKEIFELNADIVEDPNHIYPGMPLRVPKTAELPSP
jgi:nucleoid-associated protein YgaU